MRKTALRFGLALLLLLGLALPVEHWAAAQEEKTDDQPNFGAPSFKTKATKDDKGKKEKKGKTKTKLSPEKINSKPTLQPQRGQSGSMKLPSGPSKSQRSGPAGLKGQSAVKRTATPPPPPPPASDSGVRGKTTRLPAPGAIDNAAAAAKAGEGASGTSGGGEDQGDNAHKYEEYQAGVLYHIDFFEQDLLEFVKQMSEKFKVNFILPEKVKGGKITIISPNPVSREEAWQAFISALESRDLTLVRVGKFYKIIDVRDSQRTPLKTYLDGGSTDPSDEIITYLFKLKHIDLKDVDKILKDLKSKNGSIITFEPTGTLILTDTAINIRRMVKIMNELDVPGGRDSIHVIDIYYASASDVAETLEQIFGEKAAGKSKSTSKRTSKRGKKSSSADESSETQVTLSNVIADERTNQLIIVAPRDAMPRILDMINRLDVPIPGDGQVHVYYLENANADELATTLTGMAGRGKSASSKGKKKGAASGELFEGEVKITADKATNSLVIVASTKDYTQLKRVIGQLDIRRRQVFVEAVIIEVSLKRDNQQGIALAGGYAMDIMGETIPLYAGTAVGTLNAIALDPTALSGMAVGLRGPDVAGTEGLLGDGISIPSFGAIIQFLQTDSDANVLSTPHILTMDNEEAEIIVGQNVPFITGQARDVNNRPVLSIQRQDVALTMKIKPQINESNYVRLQVQQEITELQSISETLGPTTTKRAAKSTVVVKDNQTIVIGGLLRDTQKSDVEKVPFFGDLPVLGRLFRRDKDSSEKTNLLIFLTPHIIKTEDDFKRIFKRKMDERNEFLRKFYGTDDDYEFEVDYTQKTGLIESIRYAYEEKEKTRQQQALEEQETVIMPEEGHHAVEIGTSGARSTTSGSDEQSSISTPPPPSRKSKGDLMMDSLFNRRSSDKTESE